MIPLVTVPPDTRQELQGDTLRLVYLLLLPLKIIVWRIGIHDTKDELTTPQGVQLAPVQSPRTERRSQQSYFASL